MLSVRSLQPEEELRRSEEAYRAIFEQALIGFFQSSPEGYFLRANAALARIYGYDTPEALLAQHIRVARDLYADPKRRAEFQRRLERQDTVFDFEAQVRRRDGTLLWVSGECAGRPQRRRRPAAL